MCPSSSAIFLMIAMTLPTSPGDKAVEKIVATVDGEPILASELALASATVDPRIGPSDQLIDLVYQRLLDQKAKRSGLRVSDEQVSRAMTERIEQLGGWDVYRSRLAAVGTSPTEDREMVQKGLLADLYVRHAVGLVRGSPHLRPELAKTLDPTPAELRSFYRDHQADWVLPKRIVIGQLSALKDDFPNPASARSALENIRSRITPNELTNGAQLDPRMHYLELEATPEDLAALRTDVRSFLESSPNETLSHPYESANSFTLFARLRELPSRVPTFAEIQPGLRKGLQEQRVREARSALARELLSNATLWPDDLIPR